MKTPEIWFKSQRTVRTIVQALVVLVPLANGVAAAAAAYLTEQTDLVIPAWAFVVLNGVVAVTAVIMGLVARLMAVPGFNDWLTRIGLGSVPKDALQHTVALNQTANAPGVTAEDIARVAADRRYLRE